MKILIIQLARLGDIYMTWPAIRGLRRAYPNAEIHFLTRPRFDGAVAGLHEINHHWSLPVSHILSPLVQDQAQISTSMQRLDETVSALQAEKFDWIINFTFSPVSSYLTHLLSRDEARVTGYSRHQDGTLCLPDEVSTYFYAQVGTEKANRVHIADIFASMLEIQYIESDWAAPQVESFHTPLPERYLVLHVGASERHKSLGAKSWIVALNEVAKKHKTLSIVLVGAADEAELASEIQKNVKEVHFVNLVGKTKIDDLFPILQDSELLIGCDSAPIHVASLTDTPTLNISLGQVNYWETGPKATLSFIYRAESEDKVNGQKLGEIIASLLEGQVAADLIVRTGGMVSYKKFETPDSRFQWDLIQAIYLGAAYPIADRLEIIQAAIQLQDVNAFAMEQIALIQEKGIEVIGPLLDGADEIIQNIGKMVPELGPLVNWYQSEKVRIPPGTLADLSQASLLVHQRLNTFIRVYVPQEALAESTEAFDGTL